MKSESFSDNKARPCVSVCVCTYKRPHVAQTVRSILAQQGICQRNIEIVVVDDDPAWSAEAIVAEIAAAAPLPIRYVPLGAQNVASARNACLEMAQGSWIAFIDDDEIAKPNWLSNLLSAQVAHGADVVKGFVQAVYPPGTPDWVRIGDPYTRDCGPTGAILRRPPATCNVFFSREFAKRHRLRFNTALGRCGGEDTEFFSQFCATGAKVIAAREAIVNEIVPQSRVTRAYLASRYKRMGQTDGLKSRLGLIRPSPITIIGKAAPMLALLWSYPLLALLGPRFELKTFAKFWYSVGIVQGAISGRANDMA